MRSTAEDTVNWLPDFIEIYNDSCSSQVRVRFPRAPAAYELTSYKIRLMQRKRVEKEFTASQELTSSTGSLTASFNDVRDGLYHIEVITHECVGFKIILKIF